MATESAPSGSGLSDLPPATVAILALSLLGLPALVLVLRSTDPGLPRWAQLALQWAIAGAVVAGALLVEDCSLGDIGFERPAPIDAAIALGTAVLTILVFAATDPLVSALGLPVSSNEGAIGAGGSLGLAVAGAITTGVVEEVCYRGYPIERLLAYTESALLAGAITWGIFTVVHVISWPLGNLLQVAAVAAVFTVVYLRRRSLAPVIAAHVLVWLLPVLGALAG